MFEVNLLAISNSTYDSEGLLHSINDLPASTEYSEFDFWYHHGDVHRDNDKPACIRKADRNDQTWVKYNYVHRPDDKPAIVDKVKSVYYFEGLLHRLAGPARIRWEYPIIPDHRNPNTSEIRYGQHALYGAAVTEDTYNFFLKYIEEQGCPPWVAWFYVCKIFNEEDIVSLKEASSDWKVSLPTSWVFNVYNLNDKTIRAAYGENGYYLELRKLTRLYSKHLDLDEILIRLINAEPTQKKNPWPITKPKTKNILFKSKS
jgi:hypothetical protein